MLLFSGWISYTRTRGCIAEEDSTIIVFDHALSARAESKVNQNFKPISIRRVIARVYDISAYILKSMTQRALVACCLNRKEYIKFEFMMQILHTIMIELIAWWRT